MNIQTMVSPHFIQCYLKYVTKIKCWFKINRSFIMMKFYYGRLKTKMLKEKQITSKNRKTNNISVFNQPQQKFVMVKLLFTLFIKRFAQINMFKLSDDILRSNLFNKLSQGFFVLCFYRLQVQTSCLFLLPLYFSISVGFWIETSLPLINTRTKHFLNNSFAKQFNKMLITIPDDFISTVKVEV